MSADDLLSQLEQEFGLREMQTETVELYGHKWTLRKLDYSDVDKANQFIFRRDEDQTEEGGTGLDGVEPLVLGFRSSLSYVAVSLTAIDGQPVCFVFKAATPEEVAPFDPMLPPPKIRYRTAERVHQFLINAKRNMDLVMELYDVYTEKLDDRAEARKKKLEEKAAAKAQAADTPTETKADEAAPAAAEAAPASPLTKSGPSPAPSAG